MLENAQDPSLVKPLRRDCWFVTDADYNAYDTLQVVDNLQKSFDENDMLSEAEILANQAAPAPVGMDVVTPSRKARRLQKERMGKRGGRGGFAPARARRPRETPRLGVFSQDGKHYPTKKQTQNNAMFLLLEKRC